MHMLQSFFIKLLELKDIGEFTALADIQHYRQFLMNFSDVSTQLLRQTLQLLLDKVLILYNYCNKSNL